MYAIIATGLKIMILFEKAETLSDAKSRGLALRIHYDQWHRKSYTLYDAEWLDHDNTIMNLVELLEASMLATITVKLPAEGEAYGAKEVVASAAVKGYGPLLYDIVMHEEDGLIPDREEVSNKARHVWSNYFHSRTDVEHLKLDNIYDPKTATPVDDAMVHDDVDNVLDYAYVMKNYPSIGALINNDLVIIKKLLEKFDISEEKFDKAFDVASISFFEMKYYR